MSVTEQSLAQATSDEKEEALRSMVPARLRADLVIKKQFFKNEEYYVVKDPLALTYHRFGPEEAYLVSLLDGKRSLAEIIDKFHEEYPNWEMDLKEAAHFINQLGNNGLLNITARKFVDFAKQKPKASQAAMRVWIKLVAKLIFFKIPLIDPSPWLGTLTYHLRWIWTRWFVLGCLGFFVWTVFWLFTNKQAFAQNDINFFSPENLFLIWFQLIFIKSLHEMGHATTSRHFGGEVHEMGVCLICFTPCGYVDSTDAYMMKYKRHKIYTVIAGIFTEFIIAAIAAHVWLYAPPGLIKNLAFNAMMVASINTVFFNMNPLMKFDGYYVISDLLEIPNLRTKSIAYCSYWVQKNLFGMRNLMLEQVFEEESNSRIFLFYAVAAFSYMGFIIVSLSQIFARVLTPYGLGQFGLALGVLVQASFLGYPIAKVLLDAFGASAKQHIERIESVQNVLLKRILPIALVITLVMIIPTHFKIDRQGTAIFETAELVSSTSGGKLSEIFVKTGQWVEKGETLTKLENPKVEADFETARINLEMSRLNYGKLLSNPEYDNNLKLSQAAAKLELAQTQFERLKAKVDALHIVAPLSGYVLTPDIHLRLGDYINPEDRILRIGTHDQMRLIIALTEKEVDLLEADSRVTGRWVVNGQRFETRLDVFPENPAKLNEYHPSMLAIFGGPAPIEKDQREGVAPRYRLFVAEAPLVEMPEGLRPQEGLRVRATLHGKPATVGKKVWRVLVSFWDNKLRSFAGTPAQS